MVSWKVVKLRGTLAEPDLSADPTGAAKTAATVAGAIFTAGLSLIAQEATLRFIEDSHPCRTASNRMAAARIGDVTPAAAGRLARKGGIGQRHAGKKPPMTRARANAKKTGDFFKRIGRPFQVLFGK